MARFYSVVTLFLAGIAAGCGGSTSDLQGGGVGDGGPTIPCSTYGMSCAAGNECCSGSCDPMKKTCNSAGLVGSPGGAPCIASTDCAGLSCVNGVCGAATCASDGTACSDSAACCSGQCNAGTCTALNTTCKTAGNACAAGTDCCSTLCTNGTCALAASFCIQTGDVCARPTDCCGGVCVIASGATLGTCQEPTGGATFCNGGTDGTVCTGCGSCCSRLCAPYAPTGVTICQPANGCHIDGDLCTTDADCCGSPGTGLPGDGNVHCEIASGQTIGICRNPTGCNPEGDVCHFKDYACSISSARNDCCAAPGNSGVCQLDALGVPRCYGLGTTCRKSGESCAFTGDCCDALPCVPGPDGKLVCLTVPDGGMACSPRGGTCTIDADCCSGYLCRTATGSTQGVCDVPPPPPYDGGVPDAAPDAPLGCSAYGQQCAVATDCCNAIPCTGGFCVAPPK